MGGEPLPHKYINPPDPPGDSNEPSQLLDEDRALGADNVPAINENLTEPTMQIDHVDTGTDTTRSQSTSGAVSKRVREANTYAQHRKSIQLEDDETMAERPRMSIPDETNAPNNDDQAEASNNTPPHQAVRTPHRRSVRVRRATDHYRPVTTDEPPDEYCDQSDDSDDDDSTLSNLRSDFISPTGRTVPHVAFASARNNQRFEYTPLGLPSSAGHYARNDYLTQSSILAPVSYGGHRVVPLPLDDYDHIEQNTYHESAATYKRASLLWYATQYGDDKCACKDICRHEGFSEGRGSICINAAMAQECNVRNCRLAPTKCQNRRLTKGRTQIKKLVLCEYPEGSVPRLTDNRYYVCTNSAIKQGQLIAEYVGEYIDAYETKSIHLMRVRHHTTACDNSPVYVSMQWFKVTSHGFANTVVIRTPASFPLTSSISGAWFLSP